MSNARGYSEIHALAQYFAVRIMCDGVVILASDYSSAIANYPDSAPIFLLQTKKFSLSEDEKAELPSNIAVVSLDDVTTSFLKNKIFVCIDCLEDEERHHKFRRPKSIRQVSSQAALSIWALSKKPGFDIDKLKGLVSANKTALFGQFKDSLVCIDGHLTDVYKSSYPILPVLAVVSQFNEIDIIEPVVHHLLAQGVDVHVIDNWSDDGSYEAVRKIVDDFPTRVSVERFPKKDSHKYEWTKILGRVTQVANERPAYKWIISNDADEIRTSPWPGVSLQHAISFIDSVGFNVVDYTVFNFSATEDGYKQGINPVNFFEYGDFGHEGWHFMQLKTWRNDPSADIASSSGHLVSVPSPRIFPLKFLLGHYSLRSNAQARKKVFKDRKPRFLANERKKGWHSHYDKIAAKQNFIKPKEGLVKFSGDNNFMEKFLVERISGIGVKVNEITKSSQHPRGG